MTPNSPHCHIILATGLPISAVSTVNMSGIFYYFLNVLIGMGTFCDIVINPSPQPKSSSLCEKRVGWCRVEFITETFEYHPLKMS